MRFSFRDNAYEITADDHNWILSEVTTIKSGDRAGEERLQNRRYFPTLEALVAALFDLTLRKEDAEALVELAETAKELRAEIRRAVGGEGLLEEVSEAADEVAA